MSVLNDQIEFKSEAVTSIIFRNEVRAQTFQLIQGTIECIYRHLVDRNTNKGNILVRAIMPIITVMITYEMFKQAKVSTAWYSALDPGVTCGIWIIKLAL